MLLYAKCIVCDYPMTAGDFLCSFVFIAKTDKIPNSYDSYLSCNYYAVLHVRVVSCAV